MIFVLRVSKIKPAHAIWLLHVFDDLSNDNECMVNRFQLSNFLKAAFWDASLK